MLSISGISSPFRASGADFLDEEKEFGILPETEWQKPSQLRSNLDRFRLMVGITTAPSMQADEKRNSMASRLMQNTIPRINQSQRNSIVKPEAVHVEPGSITDQGIPPTNATSVNSSNMPKRDVVEVDIITAPKRLAHNMGIYEVVVKKGAQARMTYKYASLAINLCLGLQIIVAAALTALGAADHSGSSVTALGAINTVIAGFLTYLKGSGLPGKLKYFQHEWDKVRDYIEARERDLRVNDNAFDVNEQVDYIRYIFEAVKKDIESNRADRFTSSGALHTMPETSDLQRMEKKKITELGKSVITEIKDAIHEHSDAANNYGKQAGRQVSERYVGAQNAAQNFGKQAERQISERHVGVRNAVKALSAEADELKKKLQEDSGEFEHFLERILHHNAVDKHPEERSEK